MIISGIMKNLRVGIALAAGMLSAERQLMQGKVAESGEPTSDVVSRQCTLMTKLSGILTNMWRPSDSIIVPFPERCR